MHKESQSSLTEATLPKLTGCILRYGRLSSSPISTIRNISLPDKNSRKRASRNAFEEQKPGIKLAKRVSSVCSPSVATLSLAKGSTISVDLATGVNTCS